MGNIKGVKLNNRCPTLSHLFFADDATFFIEGKMLECHNLANILHQYCWAMGQEVNCNKSEIIFSNACPIDLQEPLASELRVLVMKKTGKYLGIPSDWGKSKKEMFS